MIGLLLNYLCSKWKFGYSDTFPMYRGCHCKRGDLYQNKMLLLSHRFCCHDFVMLVQAQLEFNVRVYALCGLSLRFIGLRGWGVLGKGVGTLLVMAVNYFVVDVDALLTLCCCWPLTQRRRRPFFERYMVHITTLSLSLSLSATARANVTRSWRQINWMVYLQSSQKRSVNLAKLQPGKAGQNT